MNNIDISVIIPVYNTGVLINRCLDSVFNQHGNFSIEVILVDDGSTDNSVELINKRPEQDRIRLYRQQNSGPASARNVGIREARGKYIAFLDADDYWIDGFLSKTFSFIESNAECVAVSVAQRHITTRGSHESPQNWGSITNGKSVVINDFYKFWSEHKHICTGSILISANVLKSIGGQRVDLRTCEDLEMWAMLGAYGKFAYIPEILFVSDGGKVTKSIGWYNKMKVRWDKTPSISIFLNRLINHKIPLDDHKLKSILGIVATPLIYDKMITHRWREARNEAMRYGEYLNDSLCSNMFNCAKNSLVLWWMLHIYIRYKEFSRKCL